jgi:hypothetical protein
MMFCADWPHMWPGSTGPIHSWKRIGEILLLWSGNCIVMSTFSRKMHLNWKFCIIPCTGHFMWLFHFQLGCIHFCTYIFVHTFVFLLRRKKTCRIRCIMIMFLYMFISLQSCIFFIRDNLCSPRQLQIIMLTCRFRCIVMYIFLYLQFPFLAE